MLRIEGNSSAFTDAERKRASGRRGRETARRKKRNKYKADTLHEEEPHMHDATDARKTAVLKIARVRADGEFASLSEHECQMLSKRDTQHASLVVDGATKWRRAIDALLAQHCKQNALDNARLEVLCALEAAVFEIHWLHKPAHVAVSQYVALAKQHGGSKAGSFANGVLRSCARTLSRSGWPRPQGKTRAEQMALHWSVPTTLVRSWLSTFGPTEAEELLKASNREPAHSVRPPSYSEHSSRSGLRRLRQQLSQLGVHARISEYVDCMLRIQGSTAPLRRLLKNGELVMQDEAAAGVVHFLQPSTGDAIADVCAAPGGKTTLAAELSGKKGIVTAFDVQEDRLAKVREAAAKSGLERRVICHARDARTLPEEAPFVEAFDKVLVDAPCTGTGVLTKRSDLRWRKRGERELLELNQLQRELLDAAAQLVKPGGVLVYSTCSLEHAENKDVALSFFERNKRRFKLCQASKWSPSAKFVDDTGYFYHCLPHRTGTDGAFAARFIKRGGQKT